MSQKIEEADLGLTFQWPKMHILAHYRDMFIRKGPADNYHTGIGDPLHPQSKKDFRRSSHMPGSFQNKVDTFILRGYCDNSNIFLVSRCYA
jgi:hypothetical protein